MHQAVATVIYVVGILGLFYLDRDDGLADVQSPLDSGRVALPDKFARRITLAWDGAAPPHARSLCGRKPS